jgi:CheY-like chemotaxis protein
VKRTILLADDSPTIQRLVSQTFADSEFSIVSVSNGDAAVRRLEELRPDLLLADIYMPGKNGFEVCGYVRSHGDLRTIPVILLIGAFDAFDDATARKVGASAHITKPFEPQALVNLVLSLLAARPEEASRPPVALSETAADQEQPAPVPLQGPASAAPTPAAAQNATPADTAAKSEEADLLGLQELFKPAPPVPATVSEAEIDRIAERVLQKLSAQVIEDVAWDVVPDITSKVLREELKRNS